MQAIYLTSFLYQRVLESPKLKVCLLLSYPISVGEQVAVIEGRSSDPIRAYNSVFRYVSWIGDCEYITTDEVICSIELSSQPVSKSAINFGYELHI